MGQRRLRTLKLSEILSRTLRENGSVCEKKRFGPKLTVRTPQTIEKIRKILENSRRNHRDACQERAKYLKLLLKINQG